LENWLRLEWSSKWIESSCKLIEAIEERLEKRAISTILSVSFTSFSVFINTLLILTLCDTVAQKPEAQDQEFLGHV